MAQLGIGSRETVYLSITPGVGLELLQIDSAAKTVKNYDVQPLDYNESLKEIVNVDQFKEAVQTLLMQSGISNNCGVILSMPIVHAGVSTLPLILTDEAVSEAIISEVEQVYVFKKTEPVVSWLDLKTTGDMRKILHGAIQRSELDKIESALREIGAKLITVEFSLSSILRALTFSGLAEMQMQEGTDWNLLVINQNGYYLCPMTGNAVNDYYEEPVPIKSFDNEEVYNALSASMNITLMSYPASYLYIISETDMVSAEHLVKQINFSGTTFFIDNNVHKTTEIVTVSPNVLPAKIPSISLEAVGIGAYPLVTLPLKLEFKTSASTTASGSELVQIKIGDKIIEVSPDAAQKIATMIVVAMLGITALLAVLYPVIVNVNQKKVQQVDARVMQLLKEYKLYESQGSFTADKEIKRVLEANRTKLMTYSALGETVPKSLWITYFIVKDNGKIDIKGQTSKVDDIYTFYKNIKSALINSQLRLHKLELVSESDAVIALTSDTPVIYEFEITNMTNEELAPAPPAAGAKSPKTPKQPEPAKPAPPPLEPIN